MPEELLPESELPDGFLYPSRVKSLVHDQSLDVGEFWQLLTGQWLKVRHSGLKERFPNRNLVPFARRLDSDDIACWDMDDSQRVCIVHDFCAPGWERRETYGSFDQWHAEASAEE